MKTQAVSGQEIKIKDGESIDWVCCDCRKSHHILANSGKKCTILRIFIDDFLTMKLRKKAEVRKK